MSTNPELPETDISQTARIIEALVFASSKPVPVNSVLAYLRDETELAEVIDLIKARYDERSGLSFEVSGDQMAFRTKEDVARYLSLDRPVQKPLSRAALEVLAIIAYHQPITRSEIEEIRGISLSRGTLDILLELEWVRPRGRRRTPGRPLTWGTSPAFLDHFGLTSTEDLPGMEELKTAGLLRKGQILGGLGEGIADDNEDGNEQDLLDEGDLLDTEFEDQFADEFETDPDQA